MFLLSLTAMNLGFRNSGVETEVIPFSISPGEPLAKVNFLLPGSQISRPGEQERQGIHLATVDCSGITV